MKEAKSMESKQAQPSFPDVHKPAEPKKQPPRRRFTLDHHPAHVPLNKRVRIPPVCFPAMLRLQQELGLRSLTETIHWLIHHVRPQLVPPLTRVTKPPPVTRANRPSCSVIDDSALRPVCMEYLCCDKPVSYLPLAVTDASFSKQLVRATVVQASTVFFDTPATLDKAERLISGAAAYGSKLVVFPEAFLGGYPRCMKFDTTKTDDDDRHKYFASAIDVPGPEVDRLAKLSGKYKVHLVIGAVERAGISLYSTVLFFDSAGNFLGQHRKLKPMPSETAIWHSGEKSSPPVYETSIGKIGGLICWDNKYPLLRSELYEKAVEMYCAPSADAREIWKASVIHTAIEGSCFVLSANQFCRRRDYPLRRGDSDSNIRADAVICAGGSIIVSPTGSILAGPNYHDECLISADLDLVEITRAKAVFGTTGSDTKPTNVDHTANDTNPISLTTGLKSVAQ